MVGTVNEIDTLEDTTRNKGKSLHEQRLRVDFIRPNQWWHRPKWRLVQPLHFRDVVVPSGFISDMGTTPRWIWFAFDPVNQYADATIIHDFALKVKGRKEADQLFKEALKELNIAKWRMYAMYFAVRSYGESKIAAQKTLKSTWKLCRSFGED